MDENPYASPQHCTKRDSSKPPLHGWFSVRRVLVALAVVAAAAGIVATVDLAILKLVINP